MLDSGCAIPATFTQLRTTMLQGCGSAGGGILRGCHQLAQAAGELSLRDADAFASLVNKTAVQAPSKIRVRPGDPEASFLWQKLNNTQGVREGNPMPQGEGIRWQRPPAAQMDLLRCWIAEGAPNN